MVTLTKETRKDIIQFLRNAHCPANINGYNYAKAGIGYAIANNGVESNKLLLIYVAEQCDAASAQNVERCLRTFIAKIWPKLLEMGVVDSRPSIREFFVRCMEYITLEMAS